MYVKWSKVLIAGETVTPQYLRGSRSRDTPPPWVPISVDAPFPIQNEVLLPCHLQTLPHILCHLQRTYNTQHYVNDM